MKKKTQLQDFGYGTKPKKGLVLRGDVSYDNGAKYSGALKSVNKQIPHGYGLYFFPEHGQMKKFDGIELAVIKYYSGNFKNGLFHGKGTFRGTGDYEYIGQFKNGKLDGKGEIKYADDNGSFKGIFKNDKKVKGKWIFKSGDQYDGDIKDDTANGFGKSIYKESGTIYIGEFKDGAWHGKGTQKLKDSQVYVGSFKNGRRHGYGEVVNKKSKVSYKGNWVNGVRKGYGEFDYGDGGIYKGNWKDDKPHGKGVMYETKGKAKGTSLTGTWKNGDREGVFIFKHKSVQKNKQLFKADEFVKYL